ncbi:MULTISPECIES: YPDG domain-containing protein [unclassified Streptococcus]|uniref:YPDG domain-containing protein n=1 Tax=unclassified Streptococcus TaxID=2608887 RepID=UPI001431B710|nr:MULTISPECIES: YPDG domain-containing protein [unclassified Streptococcus]MBF0775510.1 YPDG domain-containing protein [Streptococcus sp. 19428wD3_AN2]
MENHKRRKFDWYGLSQRFSIRKYHFGAASVLLGTAMTLLLAPANAAANEVASNTASPTTEVAAAESGTATTPSEVVNGSEVAPVEGGASATTPTTETEATTTGEGLPAEASKSADVSDSVTELVAAKEVAQKALKELTALTDTEKAVFEKEIDAAVSKESVDDIVERARVANENSKLAAEQAAQEAKASEAEKASATPSTQEQPVPTGTAFRRSVGFRSVTPMTYQDAIATVNALSHLNDIEKAYYIGQIAEQAKGIINKDAKVAEILAEAQAHNDRVSVNRGTSEADAIESANVTKEDKNTISGDVRLKYAGNVNDNADAYVKGLGGVTVYAQWYEKNGLSSPIYKTVTKDDGSFVLGMAPFIGADGKKWTFNAYASLGAGDANGEKWRIWSVNPDTNKYELLYSYGEEQISPEGSALDTTAGAGNHTATQRLTDIEIQYAYKNSDVWKQDAKQTPASPDKNEGGVVSGSVYWNNNNPQGNQIWNGLISREKEDIGLAGVNVYASYLSDYAVAELNKLETLQKFVADGSTWAPKVNNDKTSNIRGDKWTRENEEKLREYLIAQIKADRAKWIAETIVTKTDAKGDYKLQFNGTFGQAWNNPGFDGVINSRDSVLRNDKNVTNGSGVTKKGTEWMGTVADSPSYGKFASTGADSGTDLNKAPKHINLDWMMVIAELDGISFTTPFYGDVPRAANSGAWGDTLPTFWNVGYNIGTKEIPGNNNVTNVRFAAFHNNATFDIVNYDSYSNYAGPGDTATAKTTGVKPVAGEYYKIVWKDENGKVVNEGTAVQAQADGTLPDSTFTVPSDLTKTTTYFAELYAVNADGTLPTYPIQTDSFTAVYKLLPKYEVTYADKGATNTASANPTFDLAHTKDVEEKLATPEGATFSFVPTNGSDAAPANFSINAKTGVITWKNATEDTSVDVLVTYKDGTTATVTAEFKVNRAETETDKYTPAYTDTEVKAGQSETSALPTFTGKDGASVTPEAPVTYKLGDTSGLPAGVMATIDSATGAVTLTAPDGLAAGTEITVPVIVTYKDQTTDTATAKFTVVESDKDKYTPSYTDVAGKPGQAVVIESPSYAPALPAGQTPTYAISTEQPAGTTALPAGTVATVDADGKVSVTVPADAAPGTEYTIPVEVTYPDGSKEVVPVKVTVTAPDVVLDKDKYTPAYTDVAGKPGEALVTESPRYTPALPAGQTPTYAISTEQPAGTTPLPAGTVATVAPDGKVSVTVPADAAPGTEYTIPVEVTYPDGSKEVVPVKVTVAAPDQDSTKPTIAPIADQTVVEDESIVPITVTATDDSGKAPTVTVTGLPTGVVYTPDTGKIEGVPTVENWGDDEERVFPITVTARDEAGNETTVQFNITVQRDTDSDGNPDVTDPDDDNDDFTDDEEKKAGTDPKDPNSKPTSLSVAVTPATVLEKKPVPANTKVVTPNKDGSVITSTPTFGLSVDENGNLVGTPTIDDWGNEEELRVVTVPVTVTNGNETKEVVVLVAVQRDTDNDGIPDRTDSDDDNDGFTDEEEKTAGSNPKDPASKPTALSVTVTPTLVTEKTPVPANTKVVTPNKAGSVITSTPVDGISVDENGNLTGTPIVTDWGNEEEERVVAIPVTVTNGNETKNTVVPVGIRRDTDGDGIPDITDPDDDNDGFTDDEEKKAGTDPKNPTSKPTTTIGAIDDRTVIEKQPIADIDVSVENKPATGTVEVNGLPGGLTYDPATGKISGTPTVTDWTPTEEEREFPVKVVVKDGNGTTIAEKDFTIKVQRDTDGDQDPDVTDPDDDNDGYTDEQERKASTDPKDPTSKPTPTIGAIDDKTVIEKQPIAPIDVPVTNVPIGGTVEVTGLPGGLTYNPATGTITGTPSVDNWGPTEEEREFPVKVVIKDGNGTPIAEKEITIKVQRDTDGDQDPDVTDPDDDNDDYTDNQEKTAGTDSKDPNSKPTATIGAIEDKTVIEKQPIAPIDVPVTNVPTTGSVEVTGLPGGLTYDPATGTITGTPTVDNWGPTEEEREFPVKVVIKDGNGTPIAEKEITIKVQRDTDGDKDPDVTDPDDDNDDYTDDQEKTAGTDSKDPNSKPTATIGAIDDKTVIEKQPIAPIDVPVTNVPTTGSVEVTGLPGGLTYDPATGTITGTPTVDNWGPTEEEREFPVKVVIKDGNGTPIAEKEITIKVQRDTDGDKDPDVTDSDDDNDGYTDDQEKTAGTDSKDPNSKPTATIGAIDDKTVIEKQPIAPIEVPVTNVPNKGTVEVTGLPGGLTYDPATGTITGTPSVDNWGPTEEEREFPVKVVIKDGNGKPIAEKEVMIKVQRDTDGDKDPDVTDSDDDNDGYTDDQEKTAGTDSKDPNSKPVAPTVKSAATAVLPKTGTATSNVGAYGLVALGAAGLLALGKRKKEEE